MTTMMKLKMMMEFVETTTELANYTKKCIYLYVTVQ